MENFQHHLYYLLITIEKLCNSPSLQTPEFDHDLLDDLRFKVLVLLSYPDFFNEPRFAHTMRLVFSDLFDEISKKPNTYPNGPKGYTAACRYVQKHPHLQAINLTLTNYTLSVICAMDSLQKHALP